VPVIVRDIDNPLEAEQVIIESNRQREKTASEVMHEAENFERIIAEENRRKMLAGVTEDGAGGRGRKKNPVHNCAQGSDSERKTRSRVAEEVGMGRGSFDRIKTVYETAKDEDAPAPVRAVAQQQMAALDTKAATKHTPRLPRRWRVCGGRLMTLLMRPGLPTAATVEALNFSLTM